MFKSTSDAEFYKKVTASAFVAAPYGVYVILLILFSSPTRVQWVHADPILYILPLTKGALWSTPLLLLVALAGWQRKFPVSWSAIKPNTPYAISGILVVTIALGAIRVISGPEMPSFIPPEESSRPGYLLGMQAGLLEEVLCRLMIAPLCFFALRKKFGFHASAWIAILITALCFALLHEVAAPNAMDVSHFVARFMIPGVLMGAAMFYISPVFVVSLHCFAHILIPTLFASMIMS